MMRALTVFATLLLAFPVLAQQSASYKLTESVFNEGGHPDDSTVLTSASFRITLDAIGDGLSGVSLSSGSFRVDGGFVGSYPPPGEVQGLFFFDKDWMWWDLERSAGDYNVYRDDLCLWPGISAPPAPDPDIPSPGSHHSYLVTVENLLDEEGTKGYDSYWGERPNDSPCP
jgi:hypothetical protein